MRTPKNKTMERKVGEIFFDGNVTLQVEKEKYIGSCVGCYYDISGACARYGDVAGACVSRLRTDHQSVIFKEIQL